MARFVSRIGRFGDLRLICGKHAFLALLEKHLPAVVPIYFGHLPDYLMIEIGGSL